MFYSSTNKHSYRLVLQTNQAEILKNKRPVHVCDDSGNRLELCIPGVECQKEGKGHEQ